MSDHDPKCDRCHLVLTGYCNPTDCDYCDPLCPVWGTHSALWTGDEEESRALCEAVWTAEAIKIPQVALRPLTLDWSFIAAAAERCGRGLFKLRTGGLLRQ